MDPGLKYPGWQGPLHAAIVELETTKLRERLETAEVAISNRTQELATQCDSEDELRALAGGLYVIRMLRNDRLHRLMRGFNYERDGREDLS